MVDPPPQLFNFVFLSVISWTPVCFFPLMITVYVPMQSDPFVNAFICFCSRHLGIRYVLEFGPPLLHLHFLSSLDFFPMNVWHFEFLSVSQGFLITSAFCKEGSIHIQNKAPLIIYFVKLSFTKRSDWVSRQRADWTARKNLKTQSSAQPSRLQMSQTFVCCSLFVWFQLLVFWIMG